MSSDRSSSIASIIARVAGRVMGRPQSQADERRQEVRFEVRADDEGDDRVLVTFPPFDHAHPVRDLSTRGLCFSSTVAIEELPGIGHEADANVLLGGIYIPVRLHLLHNRGRLVGCRVLETLGEWREELSKILDPERVGAQLKPMASELVDQEDGELEVTGYHGGPTSDLFVWSRHDGSIARAHLYFTWHLVEWSDAEGLRTGEITEPPDRTLGYAMADLFELQTPPDEETLTFARKLLAAAEVPDQVREVFST